MKDFRAFGLRTQLAVAAAFLLVFALGLGGSLAYRNRADAALAAEIKSDLAIAVKLPKLKALLHSLDLATAEFLRTGNSLWIGERRRILSEIGRTQDELAGLVTSDRERAILKELDRRLAEQFEVERGWVQSKQAKRLRPTDAALMIASRRSYEDVLEIAMTMHDAGVETLPGRAEEARRRSREGLWGIFCGGLLAIAALSWGLWHAIIAPIRRLADYAARWQPGHPWNCAVPSASPEIRGLFARMNDLGDRLNAELLKEKELGQLKSQLVSMVSHDLNNALSVIHAASVCLEETEPAPSSERRQRTFRILKGQALSLSRTVANLLNLGRLQSGRLSLAKKQIDIPAMLREAVDLMEVLFENKSLSVHVAAPNAPIPAYADPEALTLVLTNLVSNAIKYTPEGGRIEVGCERDAARPDRVRVYVKDSGIGVQPEERERIFAGFYRAESGKKIARGFGIGLSMSRSIIEAHGGRIELDSEPGKGSTFSFTLPAWVADGAPARPAVVEAAS
jgi:two-component system, OmpR family, sensor histidine kinase MtrB